MALEHNEYDTDSLKDFNYPFTNIVLEGGGSKGLAYVGALQVYAKKTLEVLESNLQRNAPFQFLQSPGLHCS